MFCRCCCCFLKKTQTKKEKEKSMVLAIYKHILYDFVFNVCIYVVMYKGMQTYDLVDITEHVYSRIKMQLKKLTKGLIN